MTCHHVPKNGGTQITTEFDYTVPGSVLGKVADRLLIEKLQRRDFQHSLENLKLLVEESVPASQEVPV
jgi:coenzyme Q-binding protein COQ10